MVMVEDEKLYSALFQVQAISASIFWLNFSKENLNLFAIIEPLY